MLGSPFVHFGAAFTGDGGRADTRVRPYVSRRRGEPPRGVTLALRRLPPGGACDMVLSDAEVPRAADVPANVHQPIHSDRKGALRGAPEQREPADHRRGNRAGVPVLRGERGDDDPDGGAVRLLPGPGGAVAGEPGIAA